MMKSNILWKYVWNFDKINKLKLCVDKHIFPGWNREIVNSHHSHHLIRMRVLHLSVFKHEYFFTTQGNIFTGVLPLWVTGHDYFRAAALKRIFLHYLNILKWGLRECVCKYYLNRVARVVDNIIFLLKKSTICSKVDNLPKIAIMQYHYRFFAK